MRPANIGVLAEVAAWQVAALLLAGTDIFTQMLVLRNVRIPAAQSLLNYALLSCHFLLPSARKRRDTTPASRQPKQWQWALLSLIDVQANYFVVWAYQYTDITSVTLLDCFTLPCIVLLSSRLLGVRYSASHFAAVSICLSGLGLLMGADIIERPNRTRYSHPWVGDCLVLVGAALCALSNVAQEQLVRISRARYFGLLGLYGVAFSILNCALFERRALAAAYKEIYEAPPAQATELAGLLAGFSLSLYFFYVLVGYLLSRGSSALFMNLSLLTADFWSVLVGVACLGSSIALPWYPIAFSAVIFGLLLYHYKSERSPHMEKDSSRAAPLLDANSFQENQSVASRRPSLDVGPGARIAGMN